MIWRAEMTMSSCDSTIINFDEQETKLIWSVEVNKIIVTIPFLFLILSIEKGLISDSELNEGCFHLP